jgi:nicotinamide-nucleotide amidase
MPPKAEIFSQGEEIVTGQTIDDNAAWLSQRLVEMGFQVIRHTAVGDNLSDLAGLLQEIAVRADCCICTGGLGPTLDDLTAEAVVKAFRLPLQFDVEACRQIEGYFAARGRIMPEVNRKQALLPQGALRLDNDWGTAPGFALQAQRCWFAFAPGVPYEMRQMFEEKIRPQLEQRFVLQPCLLATIKTVGIGESDIQQRLGQITIPAAVRLGFRARRDEVQTKLLFPHDFPTEERLDLVAAAAEHIGDAVFAVDYSGSDSVDLAAAVDALMSATGQSLAVAETASQGLIAAKCANYDWLLESRCANTAQRLCRLLGVDDFSGIETETESSLANALRAGSGADLALLQLYAGDRGALHDKDKSIILHHVLAHDGGVSTGTASTVGPLARKQNQAALLALDFLRRYLQGLA